MYLLMNMHLIYKNSFNFQLILLRLKLYTTLRVMITIYVQNSLVYSFLKFNLYEYNFLCFNIFHISYIFVTLDRD